MELKVKEMKEMKEKTEQFFVDAFCAQKATLLKEKDGFNVG